MSALTNPEPRPSPAGDPGAAAGPKKPASRLGMYVGLVAFGAAILAFMAWQQNSAAQRNTAPITAARTAKVAVGNLSQTVRVTGVTTATNYALVEVPRLRGGDRGMNILKMAPSGSMVKKGELVVEFDAQSIKDRVDDEVNTLRDRENDLKKLKVQQALDLETLQQTIRVAKAELDKARYDIKAAEVRTDIDRELLRLSVEEYEARYKELLADLKQKEASQNAEMRISQINYEMQKIRVDRSTKDIDRLAITAPMSGMVVYETINRPGGDQMQIQVGDTVNPGQRVLRIIDPSSMQVTGTIDQSDSSRLRIGQDARIGLDAYPGAGYRGEVFSIGALATRGFRDQYFNRTIPIRVKVGNPDPRMIPDLSASADVILSAEQDVLVAPMGAVERAGEKAFVYVKGEKGFEKREVVTGLDNGVMVAVTNGLKPGDEIRVN